MKNKEEIMDEMIEKLKGFTEELEATKRDSNNDSGKLKKYTMYLSVDHMEHMDLISKAVGLKMADMVRQAIREFLDREFQDREV